MCVCESVNCDARVWNNNNKKKTRKVYVDLCRINKKKSVRGWFNFFFSAPFCLKDDESVGVELWAAIFEMNT